MASQIHLNKLMQQCYCSMSDLNGNVPVVLVMSKTKVTPFKHVTTPR